MRSPWWNDQAVLLKVWIAEWVLEEDNRVLGIGDELTSWLNFSETERRHFHPASTNTLTATATPLPTWPGQEWHRHPTRLDVGGVSLYWDAPDPATGTVAVQGTVEYQRIDAPRGFPETTGQVRGLRILPFGVLVDLECGPQDSA